MNSQSAAAFQSDRRIHVALAVSNLKSSVEFYRVLFGKDPTKLRTNYCRFEIEDPAINLALNESGGTTGPNNSVAHFGIQVKSSNAVREMVERFNVARLETIVEENVVCCYAEQYKVWAKDPDGNRWEVFLVLDDDARQYASTGQSDCCRGSEDCCQDKDACCETSQACCQSP